MDTRLAILLAASALLVVSVVYVVISLIRPHRPLRVPEPESVPPLQVAEVAPPSAPTEPDAADERDAVVAERAAEPGSAEPLPAVPEYRMIAPVELSFHEGSQRVGIKPGTATFLKYQRLAAVLLGDLKRSRQS